MTTTELIELLKRYEHGGASGKPRNVMVCINEKIYDINIKGIDTGDGLIPELYLDIEAEKDESKYEYHYDHTDCIWYRPEARNRCPVTCAQYRDGWNDAMQYIFRDGKGYMPYRRDKQYGE